MNALQQIYTAIKNSDSNSRAFLFIQLIAHIGLVALVFLGTWWQWGLTALVYFLMVCVGFTVTYHRLLSHKAWHAPTWFRKFGILCGVLGAYGTPISFVSQHRMHHRYVDKRQDTYSVVNHPVWYVQWFSMLEYCKPFNLRNARDLFGDNYCVWMHKNYFKVHTVYVLLLLLVDPFAVVYLYLAPVALTWNAVNALNSIAHQPKKVFFGYRNFKGRDSSVNVPLLGYITFGEGWHANHHYSGRAKSFGVKWWELDVGYHVIRLFEQKKLHY